MDRDPAAEFPSSRSAEGPGVCPANDFVPLVASHMMAAILRRICFHLVFHHISPQRDRSGLLSNFSRSFAVS